MAEPIEYRPTRSLRVVVAVCLLLFGAFFAREVLVDDTRAWVAAALGLCTLIGIAAVLETLVAKVTIGDDAVVVRDLFRSRAFTWEQIESVKLEGGSTALRMRSGKWEPLPEWMPYGASMSARHRIAAKLEREARDDPT